MNKLWNAIKRNKSARQGLLLVFILSSAITLMPLTAVLKGIRHVSLIPIVFASVFIGSLVMFYLSQVLSRLRDKWVKREEKKTATKIEGLDFHGFTRKGVNAVGIHNRFYVTMHSGYYYPVIESEDGPMDAPLPKFYTKIAIPVVPNNTFFSLSINPKGNYDYYKANGYCFFHKEVEKWSGSPSTNTILKEIDKLIKYLSENDIKPHIPEDNIDYRGQIITAEQATENATSLEIQPKDI